MSKYGRVWEKCRIEIDNARIASITAMKDVIYSTNFITADALESCANKLLEQAKIIRKIEKTLKDTPDDG